MYTEYLLIDNGGKGKIVEDVRAILPYVQTTVFPQAFIVEAIDLSYLSGLVVSSQKGDPALVSDLQGQQQDECFNAVQATVNEISEKEVGDVGRIASDFEEFQEIVELAVDISADGNRGIDAGQVRFFGQNLLSFVAQHLHAEFFYEFVVFHLLENILDGLQIILHEEFQQKYSKLWLYRQFDGQGKVIVSRIQQ